MPLAPLLAWHRKAAVQRCRDPSLIIRIYHQRGFQFTGGSGELACSADMLLEAVAACAGVTLRAVATASGVTIRGGRVIAEGSWDARGTLGIDRSVPVGLTDISLRFEIDSDADPAKLERMIQTTERYCVILQTLRNPPRIAVG